MVDYGVKIYNNDSKLIIDSKYRNHILVQSGSNTFTNSVTVNLTTPTTKCPILATRNTNTTYVMCLWKFNQTGSNFVSFTLWTEISRTITVDWRVYSSDVSTDESPPGYGLKIRNPSNELCFDSGCTHLDANEIKILSPPNIALIWTTPVPTTINHPNISNPYYIVSPGGHGTQARWVPPQSYTWIYHLKIGIVKINATSSNLYWFIYYYYQVSGQYNIDEAYSVTQTIILVE